MMKKTDFQTFQELAKTGDYIPVWREILLDLETPVGLFSQFLKEETRCFFLESVEQGENVGRFSFIGINPYQTILSQNGKVRIENQQGDVEAETDAPICEVLKSLQKKYTVAVDQNLEINTLGFYGFLSFEQVSTFEDISFREKKRKHDTDAIFFVVEQLFIFDHVSRTLKIVTLQKKEKSLRKSYEAAQLTLEKLKKRIQSTQILQSSSSRKKQLKKKSFRSNVGLEQFISHVKSIKKYIRQGDAIQVVYSHQFDAGKIKDPFKVYRALRVVNPSPYMFYFQSDSTILVGSSPEILIKKEKNKAIIRPIAGTRPRGETNIKDKKFEEDLRKSVKENAEHLMLVDLGRNDIGRVCQAGSVKVDRYAFVEKYSHVMHLVSNVEGKMKKSKGAFDLLEATFPAGTVSGAPKIRAMEIIDEFEPVQRGPYAGALGYVSFSDEMDMCIMIRTIFIEKSHAYIQSGAGIVYDSNPKKEYEETVNKAKAVFKAVLLAEEMD